MFYDMTVMISASLDGKQGDQIGRNFTIWAIFYGEIFSRKNCPMIWAKF
jgi:hypothetical protein